VSVHRNSVEVAVISSGEEIDGGGYRTVVWSSSQDVIDSPESGYTVRSRSVFAGLGLLFRLGG
jgi:hypothetical protein